MVHKPLLPNPILRPHLTNRLTSERHKPLVLLFAPSGYGKSSLWAQYRDITDWPVALHHVRAEERDLFYFYHQAMQTLTDAFGLPAAPQESNLGEAELSRLARQFADALKVVAAQHGDFYYVFENVDNATNYSLCESWLNLVLEMAPSEAHIVLIGRVLPPRLNLLERYKADELLIIDRQDLELNLNEVQALCDDMGLTPFEYDEKLGGWPPGVVLMLKNGLAPDNMRGIDNPEPFFSRLIEPTFTALSSPIQQFLLMCATLETITLDLCWNVLNIPEADSKLRIVLRQNLYIEAAPQGGYRLQALFKNYLQRRLQQQNRTLYQELHHRLGAYFQRNGAEEDAIRHYQLADAYDDMATLSEMIAHAKQKQGVRDLLLDWHEDLQQYAPHLPTPRLHVVRALIELERNKPQAADHWLTQAEADAERVQAWDFSSARVRALRLPVLLRQRKPQAAIELGEALRHEPAVTSHKPSRVDLLYSLAAAYLTVGDYQASVRDFEEALPLYRLIRDKAALANMLSNMAIAYQKVGRNAEAEPLLHEAVNLYRQRDNKSLLAYALCNLAHHYYMMGSYSYAVEVFQEANRLAVRSKYAYVEQGILFNLGSLTRDRGNFQEARTHYDYARALMDEATELRAEVYLNEAKLWRWQAEQDKRHLTQALTMLERAAEHTDRPQHDVLIQVERAALTALMPDKKPDRNGWKALKQILTDAQKTTDYDLWSRSVGPIMAVALRRNNDDWAQKRMAEAEAQAAAGNPVAIVAAEIVHTGILRRYFRKWTQQAASNPYPHITRVVEALLAQQQAQPVDLSQEKTQMFWATLFGDISFARDGEVLLSNHWRSQQAVELLAYLLLKGPTPRELIDRKSVV